MAHKEYAKLDENNYVIDIVKVDDQQASTDEEGKTFLQNLLKHNNWVISNPASASTVGIIGRKWYPEDGVFKEDKQYNSWVWSDAQWCWVAPVAYPEGAAAEQYMWDEATTSWVENPNWDGL